MEVHSFGVLVLCLRVNDCDVNDWLDLPELTSISGGCSPLRFGDESSNTLIMRSAEMNVNWLTRLAQIHITHNGSRWLFWYVCLSSSHHSWEWFSSTMKWCLDMPSLTNVVLTRYSFTYKNDVTIRGSTHFIPLLRIDIGALQNYFNWSPRGTWLLFVPHTLPIHLRAHSAAFERALSLCEHGNNDDPHLKWWKSNQNRGNSK